MGTVEWLTPQREQELVLAADAGDGEASRALVEAFLPAIAALASHYPSATAVERQELMQEGVAGLLVAARRYDARLNTRFWSYASFWVRKAMQELVAQVTGPVALSDRAVRALAELRLARRRHLEAHGAEPTADDLSRATGFSRRQIERLQATERSKSPPVARRPRPWARRSPTPAPKGSTSRCSTRSSSVWSAT